MMDTKLTLKLDEETIEKAKELAKKQKTSLSKMVENYLQKITNDEDEHEKITPLVKSLSGIIDLPPDDDHKNDYTDHLLKKYT